MRAHPTLRLLVGLALGTVAALACLGGWSALGGGAASAQESTRSFEIVAKRYAFEPAAIEVRTDDLVKITLRSEDMAHSFTIDDYRIAKRVGAGQTVTFEFRADRPGTFPFYCNIRSDDGCKQMRGTLVVRPR